MNNMQDRRKHVRTPVMMKIRLCDQHRAQTAYSVDLSMGGVFLSTDNADEIENNVDLAVHLPGIDKELNIRGKVVRRVTQTNPISGVGIEFDELNPMDACMLQSFLIRGSKSQQRVFHNCDDLWKGTNQIEPPSI